MAALNLTGAGVVGLVESLLPLFMQLYHDAKTTAVPNPTYEDLLATLNANIDGYLAEGAAWRTAHPGV
jgi:hypothetical protein